MTETLADKTEALAAVKSNGYALEYASDELKADPRKWSWQRLRMMAEHFDIPLMN